MMTIGVNVTIGVYAAFIMPFILRVNTPIDVYAPRFIYIGAISGFVCFISYLFYLIFKFNNCYMASIWILFTFAYFRIFFGIFEC